MVLYFPIGITAFRVAGLFELLHNGFTEPDISKPQELHVLLGPERATLVKALSSVAVTERRRQIRRFLVGLSAAELRYIAGYLGACLIESTLQHRSVPRAQIACEILRYEGFQVGKDEVVCWSRPAPPASGDLEHRMIVLLEYLSSCQCAAGVPIAAGSA